MLMPTMPYSRTPSVGNVNPFGTYASLLSDADKFAPRLYNRQQTPPMLQTPQFPAVGTLNAYQTMLQMPTKTQTTGPTQPTQSAFQPKMPESPFAAQMPGSNYNSNIDTSSITGFAKSMLGKPYVWGSSNPARGVDCSGLTVNAAKAAGLKIPRTASSQLAWFKKQGRVTDLSRAKPGDLLYFRSEASPSGYHTGVYMGNGRMIHAAGTGQGVIQSKLGKWYTSRLLGVGIT